YCGPPTTPGKTPAGPREWTTGLSRQRRSFVAVSAGAARSRFLNSAKIQRVAGCLDQAPWAGGHSVAPPFEAEGRELARRFVGRFRRTWPCSHQGNNERTRKLSNC